MDQGEFHCDQRNKGYGSFSEDLHRKLLRQRFYDLETREEKLLLR